MTAALIPLLTSAAFELRARTLAVDDVEREIEALWKEAEALRAAKRGEGGDKPTTSDPPTSESRSWFDELSSRVNENLGWKAVPVTTPNSSLHGGTAFASSLDVVCFPPLVPCSPRRTLRALVFQALPAAHRLLVIFLSPPRLLA